MTSLITHPVARFEAFLVAMFQVEVFWFVTTCSAVVGYQYFRDPCSLNLHPQHCTVSQPRRP